MRVITFNLRCDTPKDGANRFLYRRERVTDYIAALKADIIGFQEVTPDMLKYLRENLSEYALVGCGRDSDYLGEHNPIAYLKSEYELLQLDVSWLSPTPRAPGSRFPGQSHCPRIVTHAVLKPFGLNAPMHAYNTHLDHVSSEARVLGARMITDKIARDGEIQPFPLVLTGDMNAEPDAPEIAVFTQSGLDDQTRGVGVTWHGWGRADGARIDYVFTRGYVRLGEPEVWSPRPGEAYLSDHHPIMVALRGKDGKA